MFSERLRELRKHKKITQDELGRVMGFSGRAITKYETGEREPDFATLQKLASFFGVTVDYLLGRTDKVDWHIATTSDPDLVGSAGIIISAENLTPEIAEEITSFCQRMIMRYNELSEKSVGELESYADYLAARDKKQRS